MIEIFIVLNYTTDNVCNDLLAQSSHDASLQYQPDLIILSVNSILKVKNTLRCFGYKIWNSLTIEIRESKTLSILSWK